jgi:hypothetical protein
MDVVFDEVKGNVVGPPTAAAADDGGRPAPGPGDAERRMREELARASSRRARLAAD